MLYNVFLEFWTFWFVGTNGSVVIPTNLLTLLSLVSTLASVYLCLIYPLIRLFFKRK